MLEKAATPISIPGSALGVIVRGRLLDLTNYMSNLEAADYTTWYYEVHISENMVANTVSASMDASAHLHDAIAMRMRAGEYAAIDETMARVMGGWGGVPGCRVRRLRLRLRLRRSRHDRRRRGQVQGGAIGCARAGL